LPSMWLNKSFLGSRSSPNVVSVGLQKLWLSRSPNPRRRQSSGETQKRLQRKKENVLILCRFLCEFLLVYTISHLFDTKKWALYNPLLISVSHSAYSKPIWSLIDGLDPPLPVSLSLTHSVSLSIWTLMEGLDQPCSQQKPYNQTTQIRNKNKIK